MPQRSPRESKEKTILNVVHSLRGRGVDFFFGTPPSKSYIRNVFFWVGSLAIPLDLVSHLFLIFRHPKRYLEIPAGDPQRFLQLCGDLQGPPEMVIPGDPTRFP